VGLVTVGWEGGEGGCSKKKRVRYERKKKPVKSQLQKDSKHGMDAQQKLRKEAGEGEKNGVFLPRV